MREKRAESLDRDTCRDSCVTLKIINFLLTSNLSSPVEKDLRARQRLSVDVGYLSVDALGGGVEEGHEGPEVVAPQVREVTAAREDTARDVRRNDWRRVGLKIGLLNVNDALT